MSEYIHCRSDGSAVVSSGKATSSGELAVLPYEDGMKLVVHAVLSGGLKRYTTVSATGLSSGVPVQLVDIASAGDGAQIASYETAAPLRRKKPKVRSVEPRSLGAVTSGDGSTPNALWMSGIHDVPTVVPSGHVAYLVMKAEYYEAIESGEKRSEYRKDCKKYVSMLLKKNPIAVVLQYGYTPRKMTWEVIKVIYTPGDGFEIVLGRRYS